MGEQRKATVAAETPRGKLIRLKKKRRVRLAFEVDVELEPRNGDLNIRVVAYESPRIVPRPARE